MRRDSKRLAILWYVSESVEDVQVILGRVSSYSVSLLFRSSYHLQVLAPCTNGGGKIIIGDILQREIVSDIDGVALVGRSIVGIAVYTQVGLE